MAGIDAVSAGQRACMLGLLTEGQLQECLEDPEYASGDVQSLLRIIQRKGWMTSWQCEKLSRGDKDGYFVGGYKLLYKIASGSFGRVYRAEEPRSGKVVAIKVLRQRWNDHAHSVELFEREGKLGLTLKHPNIVQILAVDRDQQTRQHYIVMEFIEGGNLRDFLSIRRRLAPAEALRLIEDAATGLGYAWNKGLTHRDIKPTNMLISSQGTIKLVDFGLASAFSAQAAAADDSGVERTVDYAGLEKATNVRPGDVRSDIYFLGCVLYEMLTGRPPLLPTRDKSARMQKQRFETVPPIHPEEFPLPPPVIRLVEAMMALDPLQRYQTPAHLIEAIRQVKRELEGKPAEPSQAPAAANRSLFIVEQNQKLQDAMREKFKELGYRVLLSSDGGKAVIRYQQQPYDVLIVDAGTTGEEGLTAFRQIMAEAEQHKHHLAGILVLSEDQASWTDRVGNNRRMAIMIRPVSMRGLCGKIDELLGGTESSG